MDNWMGVALCLGTGLVFVLIGLPLMRGRVAPNPIYGFRTPTTLQNAEIWYPVNALSGKYLVVTGIAQVVLGLAGLAALNDPRQQSMLVGIWLATLTIGVAWSAYAGWRLSRDLSQPT
ncbi:MAG: SdpI family protein [Thermomicrobiales bacterium]|nr:SdpI family protein [Thermomicrobiales bacterium]